MSRKPSTYGTEPVRAVHVPGAVDVTEPVAGYYRYRLARGTIDGAVRLWFGPPHDPVTGEELDRSHRWQATFNGEPIEFDRVWPACAGLPITEIEHNRYIARRDWARQNAPQSAYAEAGRKYDPLSKSTPLPFPRRTPRGQ